MSSAGDVLVKEIYGPNEDPKKHVKFVEDRAGHDYRYAMDSSLTTEELGWQREVSSELFSKNIANLVAWYRANDDWVDNCSPGA